MQRWHPVLLAEIVSALQGFAKAMLDVADNLERAVGMVEGRAQNSEEVDLEKTSALLTSLHDGVKLTDKILLQVRALHPAQLFMTTASAESLQRKLSGMLSMVSC